LRYYHDASEAEMSEILGCPRGTVKSRVHNALQRLAAILTDTTATASAATPPGSPSEPGVRKAACRERS
jgi:hypothetical protein